MERRLDPFASLGSLAQTWPLDASRVPDRTRLRTTTTGPVEHDCRIETWSCTTRDGRTAPQPSPLCAHAPTYEFLESSPRRARVRFEADGAHVRAQVRLEEGVSWYGVGERAGPLLRTGRMHLVWNTDAYGYDDRTEALYQAHPWALAVHADGRATGVLFDTLRRGRVNCHTDGVEGIFDGGPFDVHVLEAAHPAEILRGLAALVGAPAPVPRWALGYHQCRYSYKDEGEVREVARRMREERVPCDALWFDIHYMDRYRVFTWDREAFPDPRALTDDLRRAGFHTVAILDPGVVDDQDDATHREAVAGDHLVKRPDGSLAGGRVWPGLCHFPDFTREATRAWWAERTEQFARTSGLDGLWCDMNEPAVLGAPSRTIPEDSVHAAGSHAEVHNAYGHHMATATRAGLERALDGRTPFVLTRAAHLGTAPVAATWTGDNQAHWDDLRWAIPMVLNLGLSGQPMAGPDLGGFTGDPDEELFVRWFELGAYLPFCRGHGEDGTCRKEPWAFGERALGHVRAALERRMRLLPTLEALVDEATRTGLPICRPLFFADPTDARLCAIDDAFLLGSNLLVAPVVEAGATERRVALPRGGWYAYPDGGEQIDADEVTVAAPLGSTPVFARAGSVVVEGPTLQHTGESSEDRRGYAFLDGSGMARCGWIEDGERCEIEVERNGEAYDVQVRGTDRPLTIVVLDGRQRIEI